MKDPNWAHHLEQTKEYPPSPLLVKALTFGEGRERALDLGAGALKDTRFLLTNGFEKVMVVDIEPTVRDFAKAFSADQVEVVLSSFDTFSFPVAAFDLVNAQYALPFNGKATFEAMFGKLKAALKKGGVFAGQFFGERDDWNRTDSKIAFHRREEVEALLDDMEIIQLGERERDAKLANQTMKHWHEFNIIARKK